MFGVVGEGAVSDAGGAGAEVYPGADPRLIGIRCPFAYMHCR